VIVVVENYYEGVFLEVVALETNAFPPDFKFG
jgi:hypothetical protein